MTGMKIQWYNALGYKNQTYIYCSYIPFLLFFNVIHVTVRSSAMLLLNFCIPYPAG
uniref:Uncharacterized protein n=1 Tax=Rhizophora mucronata TaxID=61149 RepID=A0A2P2M329_RHIMU